MTQTKVTVRLTALEDQVSGHLAASGLSRSELSRRVGIHRSSLWRRITTAPWQRSRGARDEEALFERLAHLFKDSKDKLLWLAGYNPFVASGLTLHEMTLLFELLAKIVLAVKDGKFVGNLNSLGALHFADLAKASEARRGHR